MNPDDIRKADAIEIVVGQGANQVGWHAVGTENF